jgi:hypothetical protein
MFRVNNIAKTSLLTALILLLAWPRYAHAQNNVPGGPYLNSWHRYTVTMSEDDHIYEWRLEPHANRTLAEVLVDDDGADWVDMTVDANDARILYIDIFFTEDHGFDITANSHWWLVFSEYDDVEPGNCVALRQFEITLTENNFYFSMEVTPEEICNSLFGTVLDGELVTTDQPFASTIEFTVNMHKTDVGFRPSEWEFLGTITLNGVGYSEGDVTLGAVTAQPANGVATITDNTGGEFLLTTVVTDPSTTDYTQNEVHFIVNIVGPVSEEVDVTLTITGGVARTGLGLVTMDNLEKPPPDKLRAQTITILGLPKTNNIALND